MASTEASPQAPGAEREWGQWGGARLPEWEGPRLSLREREEGERRLYRRGKRKSRKEGKKRGEFMAAWKVFPGGQGPPLWGLTLMECP